jgi:hypothetical protein
LQSFSLYRGASYRGQCFALPKDGMISFLFALLIVLVLGALPAWPYSRTWGYYPSGLISVVLIILIVMALSGRL